MGPPNLSSVVVGRKAVIQSLVAVQVLDGIFNAIPSQWVRDDLEHLGFPYEWRFVFPIIKGASVAGLLVGFRRPSIGRLTSGALIAYFALAMGFHARAKDGPVTFVPAAGMLAWSIAALRSYPINDR